ncbi:hypothetical protein DDB_G0290517 [Dictyostelium discoideum AX4]|nr:hypothetical protein DDB_G0290517 [Dictyostelium discoideum AX4]EAL62119.1 hypothetical protein DDB_G0290517 [Dictyostelium discoideum AX4]|eukprot:XP_635621.1 hypothetical protein DDB_G0290517 [Dictyostelium discoideum AX4]
MINILPLRFLIIINNSNGFLRGIISDEINMSIPFKVVRI